MREFDFLGSVDIIISVMILLINFITCNWRLAQWDVNPPAFRSSWQLLFSFSLQECGSDWCRWRPDCATYCLASRWRHAKRSLCVLFLNQNLSYCRYTRRFDSPTECSSEITYTHTQIYIVVHLYTYIYLYIYAQ